MLLWAQIRKEFCESDEAESRALDLTECIQGDASESRLITFAKNLAIGLKKFVLGPIGRKILRFCTQVAARSATGAVSLRK